MTSADIDAIARLEEHCFAEPWSPLVFKQFIGADGFLIAVDSSISATELTTLPDGRLGGYVVTTRSSYHPKVAHLRNLAVDPSKRRRGIGSRLLTASLQLYASQGFERVRLEVRESNEAAIRLYRDHDFQIVSRQPGYYGDGEAAAIMSRPLDLPQ